MPMKQSDTTNSVEPLRSTSERIARTRKQFEETWKVALAGGSPPIIDVYLSEHIESDRETLRAELEKVDRSFRLQLEQRTATDLKTTVGDPGCVVEASVNTGATIDLNGAPKAAP